MNERVALPDTTTGQSLLSEHSVLRRELESKPSGLNLLVAALDAQNPTEFRRRDSVVVPNTGHPSNSNSSDIIASNRQPQHQGIYPSSSSLPTQGIYQGPINLGNGFLHGMLSEGRPMDQDVHSSRGSLSPRGNPPDPTMSSACSTSSTSSSGSGPRRKSVPETEKNDAYWEKRKRNNEAAKRSREKRRLNDMAMESQLMKLSQENSVLKKELETTAVVAKIPKLEHNPKAHSAAILSLPTIPAPLPIVPNPASSSNLTVPVPPIQPQVPIQVASLPQGLPHAVSQPATTAPAQFVSTGPMPLPKQEITGSQQPLHSLANLFPNGFPAPASSVPDPTSLLTASTSNHITGTLSNELMNPANLGVYSPFLQGPSNALMQHLSAQLQYNQAAAAAAMVAAQNRGLLTAIPPPTLPLSIFQSAALGQSQMKQASPDSTVGRVKTEVAVPGPSAPKPIVDPRPPPAENKQILRHKLLERNRRIESQSQGSSSSSQPVEPRHGGILGSLLSPNNRNQAPPPKPTIAAPKATKPSIPEPISIHAGAPRLKGLSLKQCLSSLAVQMDTEGNRLTDSSTSGTSVAASDSGESQASPSSSRGDSLTSGSQLSPHPVFGMVGSLDNGDLHDHENSGSFMSGGSGQADKDRYLERRRRNNEAAKRCRANRRALFEYRFKRAQQLEEENAQLKDEMQKLAQELAELKELVTSKKGNEDLRAELAQKLQDASPGHETRASSTPSDLTSHRDSSNEGPSGNNSPSGLIVDECVNPQ